MRIGTGYSSNSFTGAAGNESVAIGYSNHGSAARVLAVGNENFIGYSTGYGAIAVGRGNYLNGYQGFAFGEYNSVYGTDSMAVGQSNTITGPYALAMGSGNQVSSYGAYSLAAGRLTIAAANASAALGTYTTANSFASLVAGRWNEALPGETDYASRTTWRSTDPLFVIGNGTSTSARSNAMVVTKDGIVDIKKIKPQGGISMGIYTAP